ncbi:MAG: hypothetical protein GF387_01085 [Candidatus Portnoybacteria bacterium]|nr:hypothetical protein [Candidatus Portnoybacteria bacterium]
MKRNVLIVLFCFLSASLFAQDSAQFDWNNSSVDGITIASQSRQTMVSVINTGSTVWDPNFFLQIEGRWGINKIYLDPGETIFPGQRKIFLFPLSAPNKPGKHPLHMQMGYGPVNFGERASFKILVIETSKELKLINRIYSQNNDFVKWGGFTVQDINNDGIDDILMGIVERGSLRPGVAAFNGKDLSLLWRNHTKAGHFPMLVEASREVTAMTKKSRGSDSSGGGVDVFDSRTGNKIFSYESKINRYCRAVAVRDIHPTSGTEVFIGGNNGEVTLFSQSGQIIWQKQIGPLVNFQMADISNGNIVVAGGWGEYKNFRIFSPNGEEIYRKDIGKDLMGVGADKELINVAMANRPHNKGKNKIAMLRNQDIVWSKTLDQKTKTMFWSADVDAESETLVFGFGNHNIEPDDHILNRYKGWEGGILIATPKGNIQAIKKLPDSVKDVKIKGRTIYASSRGGLFIFQIN